MNSTRLLDGIGGLLKVVGRGAGSKQFFTCLGNMEPRRTKRVSFEKALSRGPKTRGFYILVPGANITGIAEIMLGWILMSLCVCGLLGSYYPLDI